MRDMVVHSNVVYLASFHARLFSVGSSKGVQISHNLSHILSVYVNNSRCGDGISLINSTLIMWACLAC